MARVLAEAEGVGADPTGDAAAAVCVARELLGLARSVQRRGERRAEDRLRALVNDRPGRLFTVAFADRFLRPVSPRAGVRAVKGLLSRYGIPAYQSRTQRTLLRLFGRLGPLVPGIAHGRARSVLAKELARVSWSAEPEKRRGSIRRAEGAGYRVIVNALGEHIISTAEADRRLDVYSNLLRASDVGAVSVKVSSIAARLEAWSTEARLAELAARLERLAKASLEPSSRGPRLVMLDMEAYSDVDLTVAVLEAVCAKPELGAARLGIVVQAYLTDSAATLARVVAIATRRVASGGAPLRVRLVKGANLSMERVDASLRGWPLATFESKLLVDHNYRALMRAAVDAASEGSIELGIASHNVFDLALGLIYRRHSKAPERIGFEMLVGIAPALARAMLAASGDVMLYAPLVDDAELLAAVAYLIRRFDETTSDDNHLRRSFGMQVDDVDFRHEATFFTEALLAPDPVTAAPSLDSDGSGRLQRAQRGLLAPDAAPKAFRNEVDTDWTLPDNRLWMSAHLQARFDAPPPVVRPSVGGLDLDGEHVPGVDPSRPGIALFHTVLADSAAVLRCAEAAASAQATEGWLTPECWLVRVETLAKAAANIRRDRGWFIAALVAETAKIVPEADVEVSEAVDFLIYYGHCAKKLGARGPLEAEPLGPIVVASPWNFPCAIAVGGIAAALIAGNAVIFKPAPEAVLVGRLVAEALWEAGVPRAALQFLPCANDPAGRALIEHPAIAAAILTGGTETARRFQSWRSDLRLFAETGGKNALIVTDHADRDLAIKHAVAGAFGHAGQKCSATSLLICEDAVLSDPRFLERLREAAETLIVGSAWDAMTDIPPLIRPPRGALAIAIDTLLPGESWLLKPRIHPDNPRSISPGIKLGVKAGSPSHTTELFGPILAVMRARDLDEAIAIANGTPYGLTAGLESLDADEQARWVAGMDAGNLYINRVMTGAIVGRQPFGGVKASVFGPGAKAGGPHYLSQFMRLRPRAAPGSIIIAADGLEAPSIAPVVPEYGATFDRLFKRPVTMQTLHGQRNVLRYRPVMGVLIRLSAGSTAWDAERMFTAATVAGAHIQISAATAETWHGALGVAVRVESPEELAAALPSLVPLPVRVSGVIADGLLKASLALGIHVDETPVAEDEAEELLKYLREQSISIDVHRYGHVADDEEEPR